MLLLQEVNSSSSSSHTCAHVGVCGNFTYLCMHMLVEVQRVL
jgi:hypothetical protein